MQTSLVEFSKHHPAGPEAEDILRKCVHCGFCNATCPTYRILGDERDSPRGRIYLIKNMLEGLSSSRTVQFHLDRCLTCRACETTCPSGVKYSRLLDIARDYCESTTTRGPFDRAKRWLLTNTLPYPQRLRPLAKAAKLIYHILPEALRRRVPSLPTAKHPWPSLLHSRTMILPEGCVQPYLAPNINISTARVLGRLGVSLHRTDGCCGALSFHLGEIEQAKTFARNNVDRWTNLLNTGATHIVSNASGCGVFIKDYQKLLSEDPVYAQKAQVIVQKTLDISEVLQMENLDRVGQVTTGKVVTFQSPCTLQHGQQLNGAVEKILGRVGYQLVANQEPQICCGAGGAYSILQPELSQKLLANKVKNLEETGAEIAVTANIGCHHHLQASLKIPVKHWIELLDF